jgi:hypothetical protein
VVEVGNRQRFQAIRCDLVALASVETVNTPTATVVSIIRPAAIRYGRAIKLCSCMGPRADAARILAGRRIVLIRNPTKISAATASGAR